MVWLRRVHLVPLAALALAAGLPAAATAAPAAAATTTTYTITNLGSLGSGGTQPAAINASGQVTGFSDTSTSVAERCPYPRGTCHFHPQHAFLWSNGTMTDLGSLVGADGGSSGSAINSSGEVAGVSSTATKGVGNAVVWTGTKMVDLGALAPLSSGSSSTAGGINDSGQVAGYWEDSTGADHPFLYSNGTMTSLPEPGYATAQGATGCTAGDINNNGQILGGCKDASGTHHTVLWQNGTVTTVNTLGSLQDIFAFAINNNGQIIGQGTTSTGATVYFLDSNGTVTNLGSFDPLFGINDNGVMIGCNGSGSCTLIDSGGTVQDLNNLIPANSGYDLEIAFAINDNGQVVATANSSEAAVLLTPN